MKIYKRFLIAVLTLTLAYVPAFASDYVEGQIWKIQSGFYKDANVIIVKIENHPIQKHVIHISIQGPLTGRTGHVVTEIPHLPYVTEGLEKSNLELVGQAKVIPNSWREGYKYWNKEATAGKAGAFVIPVSEAIDIIMAQIPKAESQIMNPEDISRGEYIHENLPKSFLKRVKATTDVFEPIDGISYEQAVDLYKRDPDPEKNIVLWEEMARVFELFCEQNCKSLDKKQEVYKALLIISMFPSDQVNQYLEPQILTKTEVKSLTSMYNLAPQPIPVFKE